MSYMLPRSGDLREKITIERRSITPDGMGGSTAEWTPVDGLIGISAKIEIVRGGESVRAMRHAGQRPADITVWWSNATDTITASDRVRDVRSDTTYNVRWVGNLDNRKRFLLLSCEAGGPTDD